MASNDWTKKIITKKREKKNHTKYADFQNETRATTITNALLVLEPISSALLILTADHLYKIHSKWILDWMFTSPNIYFFHDIKHQSLNLWSRFHSATEVWFPEHWSKHHNHIPTQDAHCWGDEILWGYRQVLNFSHLKISSARHGLIASAVWVIM